ncbi:uncharacterized protein LOC130706031 isoform X3 [Balaenoptera acutorostrata]|uniref:Uncharacterized protein LOC130706031 isoform X3 n=1 Tax=Balaenoptera acutorostrata TaxID=9767 RepID=A0ABM3ST80_BALAC|nr:uncharacterized protein LOC130706031 isoform X3 [Balaenoptera acutorostrata]
MLVPLPALVRCADPPGSVGLPWNLASDAGHTDKSEAGLPKERTRLPSWATQFTVEYQFPPSSPLQDSTQELQLRPAGRGDPLRPAETSARAKEVVPPASQCGAQETGFRTFPPWG